MTRILTLFILFLSVNSFAQRDSLLNSLGVYEKLAEGQMPQSDTNLVIQLEAEVKRLVYLDPKKSIDYSRKVYELSLTLDYKRGVASGMRLIGETLMLDDEIDSAKIVIQQSIEYSKKHNLFKAAMDGEHSMGNCFFYKGEYELALDRYFESYELAKKKYPQSQGGAANGIGLIFRVIENNEKSKEYFQEAYQLGKIYKDTADILQALNNLGIIAKNEKDFDLSMNYYVEGLDMSIANNNLRREGEICYNLSVLYDQMGDLGNSFEFMERSTEITRKIGNKRGAAMDYYSLGSYYLSNKKCNKAIENFEKALLYGEEVDFYEIIIETYNGLSIAFYKRKNYEKAYNCLKSSNLYKDSLGLADANMEALKIENDRLLAEVAEQDSLDMIQIENQREYEKKLSNEKVKSRELLLWASGIVIILVIAALYFVFRSRKQLQSKNKIITDRNNQILLQKDEIEEQHNEIKDSINYAKRIQTALLSGNEEWDKIAPNHFILFKPKDVVSGDFYWAHHFEEEQLSIWVTADCTGHGVPGAFMSMLGIGFLNEIVIENSIKDGPEILNLLRAKIIKALDQKGAQTQQKDGMDLALCIWDKKTNKLQFTGANNPLWILRKNENIKEGEFEKVMIHGPFTYGLIEIAANKMPVGFHTEEQVKFKSQDVQLMKGDRIISFTDGYADQFGGDKGKKMKYRPFKQLIIESQTKPFMLHGDLLTSHFDNWIGEFEQIDDVCVIGVSVE